MNKIIVLTDYSDNASKALDFAVLIAKLHQLEILLLKVDLDSDLSSERRFRREKEDKKKQLAKQLCREISQNEGLSCASLSIIDTTIIAGILAELEKIKPSFVVLGMKGEHAQQSNQLLGGLATEILQNVAYPTIFVPSDYQKKNLSKVVFAANYEIDDFVSLKELVSFVKYFRANIEIVHLADSEFVLAYEEAFFRNFEENLRSQIDYFLLSFHLLCGEYINQLSELLVKEDVRLLAFSMQQEFLLKELTRTSNSGRTSLRINIPVLVFPAYK